jgi:hypothetical protein
MLGTERHTTLLEVRMKLFLQSLFKREKKKHLAHEGARDFKRKNLSEAVAEALLNVARTEDLDGLCTRLHRALGDTDERMALLGFDATKFSVGLSMIAVLEQFGSVGANHKKCQDDTCRLSLEHEDRILETLRNLPNATNYGKKSPIHKFLEDWQLRAKS